MTTDIDGQSVIVGKLLKVALSTTRMPQREGSGQWIIFSETRFFEKTGFLDSVELFKTKSSGLAAIIFAKSSIEIAYLWLQKDELHLRITRTTDIIG